MARHWVLGDIAMQSLKLNRAGLNQVRRNTFLCVNIFAMKSWLFRSALTVMAISLLSLGNSNFGFAQTDSGLSEEPRSIGEFRKDLKAFMKLSKSSDDQIERNAIFNLCQLHQEITSDPRFETSQHLPSFRVVIAKRLEKYSKDLANAKLRIEREAKRQKSNSDDQSGSEESSSTDRGDFDSNGSRSDGNESEEETDTAESDTAETKSTLSSDSDAGSGNSTRTPDSTDDDDSLSAMHDAAAESFYASGAGSGGPNQIFDYVGRMGPPWDHGDELVDLIVNTIDPAFWRRNGGNGSIHYYRPSQVLVVTAPQQGQDAASDLLNKIRGANDNQLNVGGGLRGAGN